MVDVRLIPVRAKTSRLLRAHLFQGCRAHGMQIYEPRVPRRRDPADCICIGLQPILDLAINIDAARNGGDQDRLSAGISGVVHILADDIGKIRIGIGPAFLVPARIIMPELDEDERV